MDRPSPSAVDMPWPGDELVYRVTGVVDRDWFYESGQRSVAEIEGVLSIVGRTLESFDTILEFGCGCGRILLWLSEVAAGSRLHGVDIDERAVTWVQDNLSFVDARVNQPLPPLDHPDGHFDLVFNHSVFTHIDRDYQDRWLAELRRVTRPGGLVLLTVHGEKAFLEFEAASRGAGGNPDVVRGQLATEGIAYVGQDPWVGSAFPDYYHTTFHAPWYVFRHWGEYFLIRAYVPRGSLTTQDFVLLERLPDDVPTTASVGPDLQVGTSAPASAGSAPAAPAPPSTAVARARALVGSRPNTGSATAYGRAAGLARRTVLRALRHYGEHQDRIHLALVEALEELEALVRAEPVAGLTSRESHVRLWDALRRNGERISRLETDVWDAMNSARADGPSTTR